jgi:hypothetical protein
MRRDIGTVLAGLGTFLIVIAVALPTYIASQAIKFPLNEYETATLDASNATYFSPSKLAEVSNVNLEATYTIKGDQNAGNSSTAVWKEFSYVYDLTNKQEVQIMTRTFAFNRKTAELVNCCGESINGDTSIKQTGVVGYVFPIGTQKKTYMIFDTTLNKVEPFVYSGTTSVNGVQAYEFVESVGPVQFSTQTVPGSFIGINSSSVVAPEDYQIHLTYYVDPVTGALINVNEHQILTLANPNTGAQALTLFNADLIATPASVTEILGLDNAGRNKLNLIETTLPIIIGILGAVLLVLGILIYRRKRPDVTESGYEAMTRELAASRPDSGPDASQPTAQTQPAQTESAQTEPIESKPAATQPSGVLHPAAAHPGTAQSAATQPTVVQSSSKGKHAAGSAESADIVPGMESPSAANEDGVSSDSVESEDSQTPSSPPAS